MTELEKHYNKHNEEKRLLTRHGKVEFEVSMRNIRNFLPQKDREKFKIADIGAGTGRYSVLLAEEGFNVTAVEPVKHNLRCLEAKKSSVKSYLGNALNLSFLSDKTFDMTLLFGPLYHLHSDEDKIKVLTEATRITKEDGIIFCAYLMNDYSILKYCFSEDKILSLMEKGNVDSDFHVRAKNDELYDYVRLEDIDRLNFLANLHLIKRFSPDGPADFMRRELNAMSEDAFKLFIEYQAKNAERPELLGAGSHIVDVLKKN